jgi:hypothetical protein
MASFWFSASFRIKGASHLHPEIISKLGQGDECHKKGDVIPKCPDKKWSRDVWLIKSPIPEEQDISDHFRWVVDFIYPFEDDIRRWISEGATADIYMSYCCDDDHCGFGLPPELLAVFSRLDLRLEVSIMT